MGGYIYGFANEKLKNPFQWCFIFPNDFLKLILEFNNINFKRLALKKSIEFPKTYEVIIDNAIKIKYIHYKEENVKYTTIHGHDVISKDIKKFIVEMYKRRLQRMVEKPIFLYCDHMTQKNDDAIVEKIASAQAAKIIISSNDKLLSYSNQDTLIIIDKSERMVQNKTYPLQYSIKYKDKILNFIRDVEKRRSQKQWQ